MLNRAPRVQPRRRLHAANPKRPIFRGIIAVAGVVSALLVGTTALPASSATSGTLTVNPGRTTSAVVAGSMTNGTGSASFVLPSATARPLYLGLQFRSDDASTGYRVRASIAADGSVRAGFGRVLGGKETLLLSESVGLTVKAGQKIRMEGSVSGTSPVALQVRVWADGATKPGWQKSYSDSASNRITAAGSVRTWSYLSTAATTSYPLSYADVATSASTTVTTTPPPASGSKPSASTTGVPAGTALTQHYGNITVTQSGAVLDKMDIHGFVTVKATNVRITNSIIRGGSATSSKGLLSSDGYAGLFVQNVDLKAEHPSVYLDGFTGNNFTFDRVHIVGNVDSMKIHGDNATVQNSLFESPIQYASDPYQGGGPSHSDNIQIQYGKNITIKNSTIRGSTNFAILGAASRGNVSNLQILGNWLDGGWCTIKLQTLNGYSENAIARDNKFGPNRHISNCQFQATPAVSLSASGNVMESNGSPITILRIDS